MGRLWTKPDRDDGCTCAPTFYVVVRQGRKTEKLRAGKNRRQAERALTKIQGQVDEGEYRPQPNIAFEVWADRWLAALERKETTRDSYRSTIGYAKRAFGSKPVRRLTPSDVAAFARLLSEVRIRRPDGEGKPAGVPLSASSRAKHLRVLSACLSSAIQHGYAARNPVKELPKAERPRAQRKESAYFTDDELPGLFAKVEDDTMRTLFLVALKTGMRQGELLALTWGDVDLVGAIIRIRRSITDGHLSLPKNHERRDVDITPDVVALLGAWWGELGRPADSTLVVPGDGGSPHLVPSTILRRELYPAMARAEIPREGPTGEKRTFHSFRHTFARVALEHGTELTWLSRHLGHSSTMVTDQVYGHWARAARKKQAERLANAFAV